MSLISCRSCGSPNVHVNADNQFNFCSMDCWLRAWPFTECEKCSTEAEKNKKENAAMCRSIILPPQLVPYEPVMVYATVLDGLDPGPVHLAYQIYPPQTIAMMDKAFEDTVKVFKQSLAEDQLYELQRILHDRRIGHDARAGRNITCWEF